MDSEKVSRTGDPPLSHTTIRIATKDDIRLYQIVANLMVKDGRKYTRAQVIEKLIDSWCLAELPNIE